MTVDMAYWVALFIMIVGLLGTFVPLLPGIPLILAAMFFYGWVEGWQAMSFWFLASASIVTLVSFISDYAVAYWQNKKAKADPWALRGAIVGSIIGLIFGPIGSLIGLILGAFLVELVIQKNPQQALKVAWAMCLAFLGGAVFRIFLAFFLVLAFIIRVW